ncbi:aldo/keto reductase [Kribbella sp. NPDC056345]|uniref:aldo/keto reductase n=1 Tax=Kribbella sp. NPDC056345 TaxID=3345789 RepID=UPI0035DAD903
MEFWQGVRRVGFGTKRLAGSGSGSEVRARAVSLVRRAVELGVNHLDTAAFYPTISPSDNVREMECLRWANEAVREALTSYDGDVVIATKVGALDGPLARPDELPGLVERELRDLGRDTLDVVYLRQQGLESVAEHFGVLAELRDKGLIRGLGLSNIKVHHLAQAQEIAPVVAVQNRYGVGFGRVNDELVRLCGEQGVAYVPYFALAGASRETGGVNTPDVVQEIAAAHDATPAQIRLAWTLSRGEHMLAIPGTSSVQHLAENLTAEFIHLSPADIAALDAVPSS